MRRSTVPRRNATALKENKGANVRMTAAKRDGRRSMMMSLGGDVPDKLDDMQKPDSGGFTAVELLSKR